MKNDGPIDICRNPLNGPCEWSAPCPNHAPNCHACKHSYMEPDSDLICAAVSPPFGRTIRKELEHCNGGKLFAQHPRRNSDGSLKKGKTK